MDFVSFLTRCPKFELHVNLKNYKLHHISDGAEHTSGERAAVVYKGKSIQNIASASEQFVCIFRSGDRNHVEG